MTILLIYHPDILLFIWKINEIVEDLRKENNDKFVDKFHLWNIRREDGYASLPRFVVACRYRLRMKLEIKIFGGFSDFETK